jgi:chaperonin cofactor prefoldin
MQTSDASEGFQQQVLSELRQINQRLDKVETNIGKVETDLEKIDFKRVFEKPKIILDYT